MSGIINSGGGYNVSPTYASAGAGQYNVTFSAAAGLTVPAGATIAQLIVEGTGGFRYRDDGVAPTSSVGMFIATGAAFQYAGPLSAIQFIAASGSPTLDVSYYKSY